MITLITRASLATIFLSWLVALALAGCVHPTPPSTPEAQLAARIEHAGPHVQCVSGLSTTMDCIDNQGLVWTACAWNICGIDPPCRSKSQAKVVAGSCGEPDWPACQTSDRKEGVQP